MTVWTISNAGVSASSFRGNPNVAISAINTSDGIACSRTSGKTPCFIMVSASAITATGTSAPYEDLSYSWDFGDPTGTEIFTNPASGQSVNANNGQAGPEAAYCYRSAGTYTVTLTIIGKNGSSYVAATKTQAITVSAWSPANIWYYDANATGANNGSSAANAYTALTTISANVNGATGDTQIYLAKGSHWTSTAFIDITKTTGLRISPTPGSVGASPIMECATETSSAGKYLLNIRTNSSDSCADVVASNVDFKISGSLYTAASLVAVQSLNAGRTLADIYFDNCSFTSAMSGGAHDMNWVVAQFNTTIASGNFDGFGIWGGSINSLVGDVSYGQAFFGGSRNWHFIIGLTNVNGVGSSDGTYSAFRHHFYQSVGNHAINRWVNFGSSVGSGGIPTRDMCVKIDNYPPPKYDISAYSSGAGGAVRVTITDTSQYTNGANVYIRAVTGAGASSITPAGYQTGQGVWVCSIVDATHVDLIGTTFTGNAADYTGGELRVTGGTDYFCVDGNNITGTQSSFDAQNSHGNINASWMSNYVIQNNAVHDIVYDTSVGSWPISKTLTFRYNRCWNLKIRPLNFSQGQATPKDHSVVFRIYKNSVYIPSSVTSATSADTVGFVTFAAASVSWSNPQTFTDNIIVDARTSAGVLALDSYSSDAAWTIDRNQYYVPNSSNSKFLFDNNTSTLFGPAGTVGTWQNAGFDLNGSKLSANPTGWTVPPTQWSDFGS